MVSCNSLLISLPPFIPPSLHPSLQSGFYWSHSMRSPVFVKQTLFSLLKICMDFCSLSITCSIYIHIFSDWDDDSSLFQTTRSLVVLDPLLRSPAQSLCHCTPAHLSRCGLGSPILQEVHCPLSPGGMRLAPWCHCNHPGFPLAQHSPCCIIFLSLLSISWTSWGRDSVLFGLASTAPLTEPNTWQIFIIFF